MTHRWIGALALVVVALVGCESGKQGAVLAMDEARLNIAAAEKAGAERLAKNTLAQAKSDMSDAEQRFAKKEFGYANGAAKRANTKALSAITEAKDKAAQIAVSKKAPAPTKPITKPTTKIKRKTK